MSPPDTATTARLGALVRDQREAVGLSMDQLASAARVSRSTIHRLEHGSSTRPTPSKLGRILRVVGLDADAVRAALDEDGYRDDVLVWLERAGETTDLADALEAARPDATPDLVALHQDGTVARISTTGRIDELTETLGRAGWLVTRPA